jgi:thiamine monophosphate synthase
MLSATGLRGEITMQFWTVHDPDQVLQAAAGTLSAQSYTVSFGPGIVTGTKKDKPSKGLGCLLCLLLLVPGLIYFMIGGKKLAASLGVARQGEFILVTTTGSDATWKRLRGSVEYHPPAVSRG